jgi:hypothetical protein
MEQSELDTTGLNPISFVLERVSDEVVALQGEFDRVTIQQLATGEITYRVHYRNSDDYEGGVIAPDGLPA